MNPLIVFWIQIIIALFLGLLMFLNSARYKEKEPMFGLMFYVFLIIILKSLISIFINITDIKLIEKTIGITGIKKFVLDDAMLPLYNLKYLVWNYFEFIYAIILFYVFGLRKKQADNKNTTILTVTTILQVVISTLMVGSIVILSLMKGDPQTYKTTITFVEILKGFLGRFILSTWRILLLVFVWITVASIYGYVANILKSIAKYKRYVFIFLSIDLIFSLFSTFVNFYQYPGWFYIQVLSVIIISVFAFNIHTEFITSIQENVVNLEKEKDIIISLMKDISTIIGSGDFELDTIIKHIVDSAVKGTNSRGGTVLLKDPLTNRLVVNYVKGLYPPTKPFKITSGMTLNETLIVEKFKAEKISVGEGLLGQVVETGDPIYIPDAIKSSRYVQTVKEHMMVTSFIAVPLKSKEEVFGVMSLVVDDRIFLSSDLSLAETLGEQAAITIKQIQMYKQILEKKQAERELSVAGEIQSSLIPHNFPETNLYEMYAFSIAAKGVGGDYYDYIDFGNNKIAVCMFDVSGKGVPAALIMVMIRSIIRTIASLGEETQQVMAKLNNTLAGDLVEDRYATGFYFLYDAEKGIMSYTNAGHGPLIIYRNNQDKFEFMDTEGMPVGIMSGVEYGQNYTTLEKGDIAILYTDGITEAMNINHEEYGMHRLQEVIRKYKRESARDIANKILEDINRFVGTAPQHDDETLLIIKTKK